MPFFAFTLLVWYKNSVSPPFWTSFRNNIQAKTLCETSLADTNSEEDVQIIKEGLEEMLMPHCEVKVSKLKATDTEPWDQYAFDVCDKVYN